MTPKLPPLGRVLSDSDFDEQSAVRQRAGSGERSNLADPADSKRKVAAAPPYVDRNSRIDHKIRLAQTLLETLPHKEPRVRLLNIAILRRDDALLTGVLESLQALNQKSAGEDRARPTILPPPPTHKR